MQHYAHAVAGKSRLLGCPLDQDKSPHTALGVAQHTQSLKLRNSEEAEVRVRRAHGAASLCGVAGQGHTTACLPSTMSTVMSPTSSRLGLQARMTSEQRS